MLPAPLPPALLDSRGQPTLERRGMPRAGLAEALAKDAYHFTRTASWPRITLLFAALFIVANLLFALVYWLGGAEIMNARAGFLDRFWFSVQTMATIGYGYLAPSGTFANAVVTIESFFGILLTAMVTGVFFSRFGTPSARIIFSKAPVIGDHDGVPTLMFRMANARSTAIVEATIRVYLTRDEILASGERVRRIHDLALRRNTTPSFSLSWTAYHPIDAQSPLHGATGEALAATSGNLLVTFTGIDDQLATTVHARHAYEARAIQVGFRPADILLVDPTTGQRYMDFGRFDELTPDAHATEQPGTGRGTGAGALR
jgi:inward rectifier potassium channel